MNKDVNIFASIFRLSFDFGTSCLRSGRTEDSSFPYAVRPERRHEVPKSKDQMVCSEFAFKLIASEAKQSRSWKIPLQVDRKALGERHA